jgi:N-dimethylarginine dimethylaminohydrolase
MPLINQTVLMSGADYFDDGDAINAYMDQQTPVDVQKAMVEHKAIKEALESAGVKVLTTPAPKNCQDGVYTANWGLNKGNKIILARLPNTRQPEETHAKKVLKELGKELVTLPEDWRFSGQGDALPCGNDLFIGSVYRTDPKVHQFMAEEMGFNVIGLQAIPKRTWYGKRVINPVTGWADSLFYDLDLAISILRAPEDDKKGLIAWCPAAFTRKSRKLLRNYDGVEKIEVSRSEATKAYACNLVSTGETIVMGDQAPKFKAQLEALGFKVIALHITELAKGGGFIRCTTLTLDN